MSHYYAEDGRSVYEVMGKRGKMVATTAVHAKEQSLWPGVTEHLNVLSKSQLQSWGEKKAVEAAQKLIVDGTFGVDDIGLPTAAVKAKTEYVYSLADIGSRIHGTIEAWLNSEELPYGGQYKPYRETFMTAMTHHSLPLDMESESSFCAPAWGFGGKTDLLLRDGGRITYLGDIKTRDFTTADAAEAARCRDKGLKKIKGVTPYDTEAMQIAANIIGQSDAQTTGEAFKAIESCMGFNIYLSRSDPYPYYLHIWTTEELLSAWDVYRNLVRVSLLQKGLQVPEELANNA